MLLFRLFDSLGTSLVPGTVGIVDNGVDIVAVISIISPLNNSLEKLLNVLSMLGTAEKTLNRIKKKLTTCINSPNKTPFCMI